MIQFLFSKIFFKVFKRPFYKWKLCRSFPYIFFSPFMTFGEYLFFDRLCYSKKVILEYGSGGSTLYFIKRKKQVYSVESNPEFYKYMNSIGRVRNSKGNSLFLRYVDVGETNSIGKPLSMEKENNWNKYYAEIWNKILSDRKEIDIIFIDGRFRVSCVAYSLIKVLENKMREPIFLIHDFYDRKQYHIVLKFLNEIECKSRLGAFSLKKDINIDEVKDVLVRYEKISF